MERLVSLNPALTFLTQHHPHPHSHSRPPQELNSILHGPILNPSTLDSTMLTRNSGANQGHTFALVPRQLSQDSDSITPSTSTQTPNTELELELGASTSVNNNPASQGQNSDSEGDLDLDGLQEQLTLLLENQDGDDQDEGEDDQQRQGQEQENQNQIIRPSFSSWPLGSISTSTASTLARKATTKSSRQLQTTTPTTKPPATSKGNKRATPDQPIDVRPVISRGRPSKPKVKETENTASGSNTPDSIGGIKAKPKRRKLMEDPVVWNTSNQGPGSLPPPLFEASGRQIRRAVSPPLPPPPTSDHGVGEVQGSFRNQDQRLVEDGQVSLMEVEQEELEERIEAETLDQQQRQQDEVELQNQNQEQRQELQVEIEHQDQDLQQGSDPPFSLDLDYALNSPAPTSIGTPLEGTESSNPISVSEIQRLDTPPKSPPPPPLPLAETLAIDEMLNNNPGKLAAKVEKSENGRRRRRIRSIPELKGMEEDRNLKDEGEGEEEEERDGHGDGEGEEENEEEEGKEVKVKRALEANQRPTSKIKMAKRSKKGTAGNQLMVLKSTSTSSGKDKDILKGVRKSKRVSKKSIGDEKEAGGFSEDRFTVDPLTFGKESPEKMGAKRQVSVVNKRTSRRSGSSEASTSKNGIENDSQVEVAGMSALDLLCRALEENEKGLNQGIQQEDTQTQAETSNQTLEVEVAPAPQEMPTSKDKGKGKAKSSAQIPVKTSKPPKVIKEKKLTAGSSGSRKSKGKLPAAPPDPSLFQPGHLPLSQWPPETSNYSLQESLDSLRGTLKSRYDFLRAEMYRLKLEANVLTHAHSILDTKMNGLKVRQEVRKPLLKLRMEEIAKEKEKGRKVRLESNEGREIASREREIRKVKKKEKKDQNEKKKKSNANAKKAKENLRKMREAAGLQENEFGMGKGLEVRDDHLEPDSQFDPEESEAAVRALLEPESWLGGNSHGNGNVFDGSDDEDHFEDDGNEEFNFEEILNQAANTVDSLQEPGRVPNFGSSDEQLQQAQPQNENENEATNSINSLLNLNGGKLPSFEDYVNMDKSALESLISLAGPNQTNSNSQGQGESPSVAQLRAKTQTQDHDRSMMSILAEVASSAALNPNESTAPSTSAGKGGNSSREPWDFDLGSFLSEDLLNLPQFGGS